MITAFLTNESGILYFFVAKSFADGIVTGKYLTPNESKRAYEFGKEVEEPTAGFENGFTLFYDGGSTSRLVSFDDAKDLIKTNPLTPRILQ